MSSNHGPLRIGIGGPVGAGKTTLTAALPGSWSRRADLDPGAPFIAVVQGVVENPSDPSRPWRVTNPVVIKVR